MEDTSEHQETGSDFYNLRESKIVLCKLCGNKYDNPKLLKCQHSFCRECLLRYLSNIEDIDKGKSSFQCPTCSELMTISCDSSLPDEQSVDAIGDDLTLKGVIDILNSSDFDISTEPGESLGTIQWSVDDLAALMTDWRVAAQKIPDCKHHSKKLEFFCKSHDRILCSVCVILNHRACNEIVQCSDVVEEFMNKRVRIRETADFNRKVAESLRKELSGRCQGLFENRDYVKAEVRKVKDEMIEMLNKAESELNTEIDEMCDAQTKQFEERIKCCSTVYRQSQLTEKCMEDVRNIQCPEFVVNSVIESEKSCESGRLLLEEISCTTRERKLYFTRSAALGPFLQNVNNFGHLTVSDSVLKLQDVAKSPTVSIRQPPNMETASSKRFNQESQIDALLSDDRHNCWITGITFLGDDRIVMVDRNNEEIKLFSKDCLFLYAVKLSRSKTTLFGIAATIEDEVAVTLTLKHRVQFLSISGNALIPIETETRCIETKQPCYGIASGFKQLFVACAQLRSSPCCVKVFDNKDNLLREIIFDNEGHSLFTSLSFSNIALDPVRNLLSIVDQPIYRHSIVTFDLSGSLKSRDFMPYLRDKVCGIAYMESDLLMALGNRTLCSLSDDGNGDNVVNEVDVDTNFHCPCALAVNMTKDKIVISQADPRFNYRSNNSVKLLSVLR